MHSVVIMSLTKEKGEIAISFYSVQSLATDSIPNEGLLRLPIQSF